MCACKILLWISRVSFFVVLFMSQLYELYIPFGDGMFGTVQWSAPDYIIEPAVVRSFWHWDRSLNFGHVHVHGVYFQSEEVGHDFIRSFRVRLSYLTTSLHTTITCIWNPGNEGWLVYTVCTLIFRHSNCSSHESKRCDCLLNDDEEWRIPTPRCTF